MFEEVSRLIASIWSSMSSEACYTLPWSNPPILLKIIMSLHQSPVRPNDAHKRGRRPVERSSTNRTCQGLQADKNILMGWDLLIYQSYDWTYHLRKTHPSNTHVLSLEIAKLQVVNYDDRSINEHKLAYINYFRLWLKKHFCPCENSNS